MARATPQYTKRIKYDFVVCDASGTPTGGELVVGSYIRIKEFYAEVFQSDTTNILYDVNGVAKVYPITEEYIIDNNQLFINAEENKVAWFANGLTPNSECEKKALKLVNIIEPLAVEEGVVQVAEGEVYVLKS